MLGGRCPTKDDVRLKFVIGAEAPAVAAERAGAMAAKGWRSIKVKVGRPPVVADAFAAASKMAD
ncbi:MAG: hypothetical protein ACRC1K_04620 [Planctomycetia bacterium]